MTLGTILSDLYRRLNFPSSPASATTTRLTAFVNEGLQELYSLPGMATWVARHQPALTFASIASTPVVTLPPGISRVEAIRDTTNDWTLAMLSRDEYQRREPDPSSITGTPSHWVPMGFSAVAKQPADASLLFIKSTAAGDTTQTVRIEGIRTGGYPTSASATLTGTTAAGIGSFGDFIQVTKFYLSAVGVGAITLHEDSGAGTELAQIPIGETFSRYEQIALWPTPSAAITYTVDAERDYVDMSQSNDEPLFPRRFHRLLVDYALWKEHDKTDDSRAKDAQSRWLKGVSDLRYFLTCPPDFLPVSGRVSSSGPSRLGSWYPEV